MKNTTGKVLSAILSIALVFTLMLGGFGLLGLSGDDSVSVFAVGSDGSSDSSSSSSSSSSSTAKKKSVKKAKLKVKAIPVTVTTGQKTVLTKDQYLSIKNAGGKKTFKIVKVNKDKKKFSINKKNGKLTIKDGIKAGTYKVKVRVKTKGNKKCKAGNKTVTVTVTVADPVPAAPVTPAAPTTPATTDTPSDAGTTQG